MSDNEQKPKQSDVKPAVRVLNLDTYAKGYYYQGIRRICDRL